MFVNETEYSLQNMKICRQRIVIGLEFCGAYISNTDLLLIIWNLTQNLNIVTLVSDPD